MPSMENEKRKLNFNDLALFEKSLASVSQQHEHVLSLGDITLSLAR